MTLEDAIRHTLVDNWNSTGDKGKPAARRGRKATGLLRWPGCRPRWETAELPNQSRVRFFCCLEASVQMGRKGVVLMITVMTAIVCAIAAYAALQIAIAEARQAVFYRDRTKARYAAEAGLVWAQQRLWQNPADCFNANPDVALDHDADPATPPLNVDVTVTPCGAPNARLNAKVVY